MPKHVHDCSCCTFLGELQHDGKDFDLYFCPQAGLPTIIARFGRDGDYYSGMEFGKSGSNAPLREAYQRAKTLNLVN